MGALGLKKPLARRPKRPSAAVSESAAYWMSRPRHPNDLSKSDLRRMLAEAAANTAKQEQR